MRNKIISAPIQHKWMNKTGSISGRAVGRGRSWIAKSEREKPNKVNNVKLKVAINVVVCVFMRVRLMSRMFLSSLTL